MFCVKCGTEGKETINGLCVDCFLDGREIVTLPHHLDLERCTNCLEFSMDGSWKALDLIEAVEDTAADSLMVIREATVLDVGTGAEELDDKNFLVTAEVETDVDGYVSTETCSTTVRLKNTVCKRCSRQLGNYYEATLQIRNGSKTLEDDIRDEIVRKVRDEVEQMARNNRQLFITKVTEVTGGVDILLSSISLGRTLARDLESSYGADFKESSKLVGKTSDGQDMYRLTYLIRLPDYHVNDVVRFNNRPYKLVSISKNGAKLMSLNDFRETTVKRGDLRSIKLLEERKDLKEAIVISRSGNEIQVMSPSDYSTVDLKVPEDQQIGDNVSVVYVDDVLYYVP